MLTLEVLKEVIAFEATYGRRREACFGSYDSSSRDPCFGAPPSKGNLSPLEEKCEEGTPEPNTAGKEKIVHLNALEVLGISPPTEADNKKLY